MTGPQRQHRWLAADHLEQEGPATLRTLGDTTEGGVWKQGKEKIQRETLQSER